MKQLGTFDAACLYFDKLHAPINASTIWIYQRPRTRGGKSGFKEIFDHIASQIQYLPLLRKKVIRAPGDIDLPWWIDDPRFDLEYHIRHIALPGPGNWQQFCDEVAVLHSRPLDLNRPLWELYVIDGLDTVEGIAPGAFALVFKAHHAAVDGKAIMAITEVLHSDAPSGKKMDFSQATSVDDQLLKGIILARGMFGAAMQPLRATRAFTKLAPAVVRLLRSARSSGEKSPPAPSTRFGGAIDSSRVLDTRFYDIDILKKMRSIVPGATLNDVSLAIFGGALRRYLMKHGELPEAPLRAVTPVALRQTASTDSIGNQISLMVVSLATDLAEPRQRLATVCEDTQRAKRSAATLGAATPLDVLDLVPTGLMAPGIRLGGLLTGHGLNIGINTIVSNVAGPGKPLSLNGCRLVSLTGAGPIVDGLGLINYVTSYMGKMGFGFTSCRRMMPDPGYYSECIDESFGAMSSLLRKPRRKRPKTG